MPELISEWTTTGGIQAASTTTFVNVLTGNSAALNAIDAAGGTVNLGADFIPRNIPIVSGLSLPTKVAENTNKPVDEVTPGFATLTVDMWAKFHQASRQAWTSGPTRQAIQAAINASVGMFPIAFDIETLTPFASGVNTTAVEYDAGAPINSISSFMAAYDETSYMGDAVVLTRAGARKLGYSVNADGNLLAQGGNASSLFGNLPVFTTLATGTQLGAASLLGVVGPFGSMEWATAQGVAVDYLPQATIAGRGPEQNIENWRIEAAFGVASGIDVDNTGTGAVALIDAV